MSWVMHSLAHLCACFPVAYKQFYEINFSSLMFKLQEEPGMEDEVYIIYELCSCIIVISHMSSSRASIDTVHIPILFHSFMVVYCSNVTEITHDVTAVSWTSASGSISTMSRQAHCVERSNIHIVMQMQILPVILFNIISD